MSISLLFHEFDIVEKKNSGKRAFRIIKSGNTNNMFQKIKSRRGIILEKNRAREKPIGWKK